MSALPLLLLPGLLCDEASFAPQLARFTPEREVVVADYGDCDRLEAMARRALDQAPPRFAAVGHSMGARVALEIARLAPGRVDRIALLDTAVHPPTPEEGPKRRALRDLAFKRGIEAMNAIWLPPMVHPSRLEDVALMEPLRAMLRRKTPEIFAAQIEALLHRPDAAPVLAGLTCPILIGVGRQDSWSTLAQHEAMAALNPAARLVVFEDAGHFAPVERPEAVNAALADWLQSSGG